MKYKTALYGRTSKDDSRRVTIEIQQQTLREWASRDSLVGSVAGEFWDADVSGKIPLWDRPAGKRLMESITAGKVNSVAVVYIDRFGRTLLDGLKAAADLEQTGAKLVAVSDGWDARRDDNPLYFQFRLMLAEDEHRRIKARMESGKQRAADRDNAPPGGSLIFGYRMGPRGQFIVDPVEAAIVRTVFSMWINGATTVEIVAWLESTGVPAGRRWQRRSASEARIAAHHADARWRRSSLCKMLAQRAYIGERVYGGRVYPVPAIIDRETWEKARQVSANKPRWTRAAPDQALCSGMLVCGQCRYRLHYCSSRRPARYLCEGRTRYRVCKQARVPVSAVDSAVWNAVREYLEDPARIIKEATAQRGAAEDSLSAIEAGETRIQTALDAIEADVRAINAEQAAKGLPFSWVLPQLEALNNKRSKLVAEQGELRSRRAAVQLDKDTVELAVQLVTAKVASETVFALPDKRREIITQNVAAVEVVSGEQVVIHFKWGSVAKSPISGTKEKCNASVLRVIRPLAR